MLFLLQLIICSQSKDFFEVYDSLCVSFLNSFTHPSCVHYSSLSLLRICQESPLILFFSQFSIDTSLVCETDQEQYKSIHETIFNTLTPSLPEKNLKKLPSQNFLQIEFNYLKGDKFYDPPTVQAIVKDLNVKLELICSELNNN